MGMSGRNGSLEVSPELAPDPARLERFEHQAKTLAGPDRPGVAGIGGVEEQDGSRSPVPGGVGG